jgi:hypothetical protein
MIFFFHCARFFGGGGWHLKNPGEESLIATLFIGLLDLWIMPLFFLLSGAGSWYALKSRNAGQYLLERVKRILIPLYGVGAFILLLPQVYFEAVTNEGYTGTFWEGLPLYFIDVFTTAPNFNDPFFFNIFMGHLWFLQYLFLISLFVLPLLLFLRSEQGQRLIAKLAGWCGVVRSLGRRISLLDSPGRFPDRFNAFFSRTGTLLGPFHKLYDLLSNRIYHTDLLSNRIYHTGGQAVHRGYQEGGLALPGPGDNRLCCRRHFHLCSELQLRQFTPSWG